MSHYGLTMYGMYYYRLNVMPWLTLAEKHRYVCGYWSLFGC